MMTAVIDTCVIIDVLQKREPFWQSAFDIFAAAELGRFTGVITAKSSADIYYLCRKNLHDGAAAREKLSSLFALFELADTAARDCAAALNFPMSDYEDAVMTATALRIGADCIVTRNLSDYALSPVPAYSPKEFLAMIK